MRSVLLETSTAKENNINLERRAQRLMRSEINLKELMERDRLLYRQQLEEIEVSRANQKNRMNLLRQELSLERSKNETLEATCKSQAQRLKTMEHRCLALENENRDIQRAYDTERVTGTTEEERSEASSSLQIAASIANECVPRVEENLHRLRERIANLKPLVARIHKRLNAFDEERRRTRAKLRASESQIEKLKKCVGISDTETDRLKLDLNISRANTQRERDRCERLEKMKKEAEERMHIQMKNAARSECACMEIERRLVAANELIRKQKRVQSETLVECRDLRAELRIANELKRYTDGFLGSEEEEQVHEMKSRLRAERTATLPKTDSRRAIVVVPQPLTPRSEAMSPVTIEEEEEDSSASKAVFDRPLVQGSSEDVTTETSGVSVATKSEKKGASNDDELEFPVLQYCTSSAVVEENDSLKKISFVPPESVVDPVTPSSLVSSKNNDDEIDA